MCFCLTLLAITTAILHHLSQGRSVVKRQELWVDGPDLEASCITSLSHIFGRATNRTPGLVLPLENGQTDRVHLTQVIVGSTQIKMCRRDDSASKGLAAKSNNLFVSQTHTVK